jgi:chaperonin GroEL (HSP60 family)
MDSSPTFQPMRKAAKKRYEHILATAREIILEQRSLSPLSIHRLAVAMILSLTPVCFEEVNQQNRAYAMALHRHLVTQSIWEDDQQTLFTCEIAMDLVDAVLRKSFIQHGSITEYYHQQALIAFTTYFEAAAIKSSISNNTKVEIL